MFLPARILKLIVYKGQNIREKRVKALIIAAHGSRKKESNREIASLADRLSKKAEGSFERVAHAFLQMAEPRIDKTIQDLVEQGAVKIVIFPFFIGSGSHILVDIPELVKTAQSDYPQVEFRITRHLGKIEGIETVILEEVMR